MNKVKRDSENEVTIQAQWGKVKALTWGVATNPPVLLCHGKLDTASSFRPLVLLLPDCFFYVSVDLPGNGRSDHFPPGALFTVMDLLQTIVKVREHFQWEKFAYIGHSLGAVIGRWFNIAYPGYIKCIIELDPVPAYNVFKPRDMKLWYEAFYGWYYNDEKYKKINGSRESAPKYSYEKALDLMMNTRGLNKNGAEQVLERTLEPVGDGLYRFTYDQRMKEVPRPVMSRKMLFKLYTSAFTPVLCILAQASVDFGFYNSTPFILDESAWPNKNFTVKTVEGGHDIHINNPELIAEDISKFILRDRKAKL